MKRILPIFAAVLLVTSCSENPGTEKKAEISVVDYDQNVTLDNDFILPQPITLIEAFSSAGLEYVKGKTNPLENKDKYSLKADQLLNVGTYSTDLAYCIMNNRTQEAAQYLAAVQAVGSKAGLESVFSDKKTLEKFEKNLDNKEVLTNLVYEIQEKMDLYLNDNDLRHLAAIQFAGAWTEGMYIACDQWKTKIGTDSKVNTAVAEQMNLLENILKGLKSSPAKDKRVVAITSDLEKLYISYQELPSVKKADSNVNFATPELTTTEFTTIANQINSIRTRIISAK